MFAYPTKLSCAAIATVGALLGSPARSHAESRADQAAATAAPPAATAPAEPSASEPPAAAAATADTDPADGDQEPAAAAAISEGEAAQGDSCLTKTICAVKEKIRWQTPAWTPSQCRTISDAVATAAKANDLNPTLILAIMINESDMNEKALRVYTRNGKVYAKDGGLMALRCVINDHDRCVNGELRGMQWKTLMDPVTNVQIGARMLAHYRDGGGIMEKTVSRRDGGGHLHRVVKHVPCDHRTHAFWAHYNHGPRYIDKGYPRHYPHRIAVLDHALAAVMNVPAPELTSGRITVHDAGKRERTPDRPIEARYKKLTNQILSSGTCSALALQ